MRARRTTQTPRIPADGPKEDFAAFVEWVLVNDLPFTNSPAEDHSITSPTPPPPLTSTMEFPVPTEKMDEPESEKRSEGVIDPEPGPLLDLRRQNRASQRECFWEESPAHYPTAMDEMSAVWSIFRGTEGHLS